MIKLVFCMKKKPELSLAEFRKQWKDHQNFTRSAAKAMHATRITHSLTLAIEENEDLRLTRGTAEPFDALIEVWWEDSAPINAGFKDPQTQEMIAKMRADQSNFLDRAHSIVCFTSEDQVEEFDYS